MLRRFRIADGAVEYSNRYVRSEDFRVAREAGRVRSMFPGTPADRSALGRLRQVLTGAYPDNPIIGVARVDGAYLAVTESPVGLRFDPETLRTTGRRDLTDGLDCDLTLGHAHYDPADGAGAFWSLGVSYGRRSACTLFRRPEGGSPEARTRLVFDDHPPYVHAFALAGRFAVVPEPPFGVDLRSLLFGAPQGRTFLDAFRPRDAPARFHVLDRESGERVAAVETDPFFVYHFANAYETGDGGVVVDCVAFPDERAVTGLTLENLRRDHPDLPRGDLVRYRLPLSGGRADRTTLREGPVEFPTIGYRRYNGRPYRYAYLAVTERGSLPTAIAKVDVEGGDERVWHDSGTHPGEAVFVPAPDPETEDDGVLLTVRLDADAGRSELVCLDARAMEPLARAPLPHRLPFAFHGQFYADRDPMRSVA
jgi:carotenoid cleavage dioxygenase-like enzyme